MQEREEKESPIRGGAAPCSTEYETQRSSADKRIYHRIGDKPRLATGGEGGKKGNWEMRMGEGARTAVKEESGLNLARSRGNLGGLWGEEKKDGLELLLGRDRRKEGRGADGKVNRRRTLHPGQTNTPKEVHLVREHFNPAASEV